MKHSRVRGRASSSTARERATHQRYQRRGTRLSSVRARAAPVRASKRMYDVHGAVPHSCEPNQWVYAPSAPARPRLCKAVAAGAAGRGSAASREGEGEGRTAHRPGDDLRRVLDGAELERPAPRPPSAHGPRARRGAAGFTSWPPGSPTRRIRGGLGYERKARLREARVGVAARVTHQPGMPARAPHCFTPLRSRKTFNHGRATRHMGIRTPN